MQADHETISKSLLLYAKYLKVMNIKNRPIIVFTKQEYFSIIDKQQIRSTNTRVNHRLGECRYGINGTNDIIFINVEHATKLYGLETLSKPFKIKKRKYTHIIKKRIGTIEYTLIHELLHSKHKGLRHGKHFDDTVKHYYRKGQITRLK